MCNQSKCTEKNNTVTIEINDYTAISPPPEPPDINSMNNDELSHNSLVYTNKGPTFAQTLLSSNQLNHYPTTCHTIHSHLDLFDETTNNLNDDTFIPITSIDKNKLYLPWKISVIVKVFGRKVGHQTL